MLGELRLGARSTPCRGRRARLGLAAALASSSATRGGALGRAAAGAGALATLPGEFAFFAVGIADPELAAETGADLERVAAALAPTSRAATSTSPRSRRRGGLLPADRRVPPGSRPRHLRPDPPDAGQPRDRRRPLRAAARERRRTMTMKKDR